MISSLLCRHNHHNLSRFVLFSPSHPHRTVPLRHLPHHCCGAQSTDINKIVGERAGERTASDRPTSDDQSQSIVVQTLTSASRQAIRAGGRDAPGSTDDIDSTTADDDSSHRGTEKLLATDREMLRRSALRRSTRTRWTGRPVTRNRSAFSVDTVITGR